LIERIKFDAWAPFGEFGPYVVELHCESNSVTSPDATVTSAKHGS